MLIQLASLLGFPQGQVRNPSTEPEPASDFADVLAALGKGTGDTTEDGVPNGFGQESPGLSKSASAAAEAEDASRHPASAPPVENEAEETAHGGEGPAESAPDIRVAGARSDALATFGTPSSTADRIRRTALPPDQPTETIDDNAIAEFHGEYPNHLSLPNVAHRSGPARSDGQQTGDLPIGHARLMPSVDPMQIERPDKASSARIDAIERQPRESVPRDEVQADMSAATPEGRIEAAALHRGGLATATEDRLASDYRGLPQLSHVRSAASTESVSASATPARDQSRWTAPAEPGLAAMDMVGIVVGGADRLRGFGNRAHPDSTPISGPGPLPRPSAQTAGLMRAKPSPGVGPAERVGLSGGAGAPGPRMLTDRPVAPLATGNGDNHPQDGRMTGGVSIPVAQGNPSLRNWSDRKFVTGRQSHPYRSPETGPDRVTTAPDLRMPVPADIHLKERKATKIETGALFQAPNIPREGNLTETKGSARVEINSSPRLDTENDSLIGAAVSMKGNAWPVHPVAKYGARGLAAASAAQSRPAFPTSGDFGVNAPGIAEPGGAILTEPLLTLPNADRAAAPGSMTPGVLHPGRSVPVPSPVQQIADAVARDPGNSIEIRLSPEELGRVRMTLTPGDHGLLVHIHADRPETLDLLRRHVDQLARDLAQAGHDATTFTFGDDRRREGAVPPRLPAGTVDAAVDPDDGNGHVSTAPTESADGLDIRL